MEAASSRAALIPAEKYIIKEMLVEDGRRAECARRTENDCVVWIHNAWR